MIDLVEMSTQRIAALGISTAVLAKLANLSETETRGLLSRQRLSNERTLRIDSVLKTLEEISKEIAPLKIDFRKAATMGEIISRVRSGDLKFVAVDKALGEHVPHAVQIDDEYFVKRTMNGQVLRSMLQIDGTPMPRSVALEVAKRLTVAGLKTKVTVTPFRIRSYELSEVWSPDVVDLPDDTNPTPDGAQAP